MEREDDCRLNAAAISKFLKNKDIKPFVYDVIDSTNMELKRRLKRGDTEYGLVAAEMQENGRGRLGRPFESPKGAGVYMSLLLTPEGMDSALLTTSAAGVAVCRAIRALTDKKPVIKWVNDVYCGGKKVCGILAEGVRGASGNPYMILGIGINVSGSPGSFSEGVRDVAGFLYGPDEAGKIGRNRLAAAVADEFMDIYADIGSRKFMDDYRKYSMVIGKPVRYFADGTWREGVAEDIDRDGGLIVSAGGGREVLSTGEITLRPM